MRLKISEVAQALRRSKTSRNAKIYRVVVVVGSKLPFSDDAFHCENEFTSDQTLGNSFQGNLYNENKLSCG